VLRAALKKYLPAADGPLIADKRCMYTYSPDAHFIIDHLPDTQRRVAVACGFSGHGFKFASVVGEILAELVINGSTTQPIDFLNLSRFKKN
jgi:glycine/D-amino acid oxidase-like deaminating enzyme